MPLQGKINIDTFWLKNMHYQELWLSFLFIQVLPKLQNLEVINFGDCLVRSEGAKVIARSLTDGHKKLRVSYSIKQFIIRLNFIWFKDEPKML